VFLLENVFDAFVKKGRFAVGWAKARDFLSCMSGTTHCQHPHELGKKVIWKQTF
jgi:hypothetical protein